MFDLLAAIQEIEPTAIPLVAIMLSSVAMYLVGIILPCSPCCNSNPCGLCTEGQLPDTVTVTFDGFTDQIPGPDLITLSFAACYGGGAAGKVTAPGGDPVTDKGPISAVSLTSGGSGYAKLGRVAPTLTVSGGSGTGATFTPTLSTSQDACDLDLWALQSVAASGGTGYEDGDTLTITVAEGDTEVSAAAATLYLDKTEPTLTLSGGATATVTMAAIGDGNYRISAVAVTSGGTGYSENQLLSFSVGANDVTLIAAYNARARVVHDTPANALLYEEGSGSGAVLTPVWTLLPSNQWPAPHRKTYYLSAVTITNGGSGYSIDDLLQFYFASNDDGQEIEGGTIFVDAVDGSGAITAVFITDSGGRYVGSRTDALHLVGITSGGSYYHDDPGARRVFVHAGGSYYREDASVAPYVATVTVSIAQVSPSAGTGASLSATIDDDTSSETFGEITGITIDDGGDDYLAWQWIANACCGWQLNGVPIVLRRLTDAPFGSDDSGDGIYPVKECVYGHDMCGGWGSPLNDYRYRPSATMGIRAYYRGPATPPSVRIVSTILSSDMLGAELCSTRVVGTENVEDCSAFSMEGTNLSGISATLTAGGDYDANFKSKHGSSSDSFWLSCHVCCQGGEEIPQEISVSIDWADEYRIGGDPDGIGLNTSSAGNSFSAPNMVPSGTYVLSRLGYHSTVNALQWGVASGQFDTPVVVGFRPCDEGCNECVKKCKFFIEIGHMDDQTRLCGADACEECDVDVPSCKPMSGSYSLDEPSLRDSTSFPNDSEIELKRYWYDNVVPQGQKDDPCTAENTYDAWKTDFIPYNSPCTDRTAFIRGDCGAWIGPSGVKVLNYAKFVEDNVLTPTSWFRSNMGETFDQSWRGERDRFEKRVAGWHDPVWREAVTVTIE